MKSLTNTEIKIPNLNKTIPVSLVNTHRSKDPKFNRLCPKGHKVKLKNYCPVCDKDYEYSELKLGYKLGDKYIPIPKEIRSQKSTPIMIKEFVDPIFTPLDIKNIYYLIPKDITKNYTLLLNVLAKNKKIGIGKFTFRNKEHIVGLLPYSNMLILIDFYEKDEITNPPEFSLAEITAEEMEAGKQLLSLREEIDLKKEIGERLQKVLENPERSLEIIKEVKEDDLLGELSKLKKEVKVNGRN